LTPAEDVLPSPEQKASYVRTTFGRIARRYDLMNRLMTLGRDRAWRRYTVKRAEVPAEGWVLDIATGTGDLALETLSQEPQARVVGLDFTPEMLDLARDKAKAVGIPFGLVAADALRLPFAEAALDSVVTGFALRNVTDIPAAFAEMARVVRPGGRVACLEIAKPRHRFLRRLFEFYFYRLVPLLGGWITGERSAYTYLPHSLTAFLTPDEIAAVMRRTGWQEVDYRRMMLGTVAVHAGRRDEDSATRHMARPIDSLPRER
jgi:demethylmenaquinone methyltransferase/2-methoxy-6-polyprenyl-1,4-benzoquinol methylase